LLPNDAAVMLCTGTAHSPYLRLIPRLLDDSPGRTRSRLLTWAHTIRVYATYTFLHGMRGIAVGDIGDIGDIGIGDIGDIGDR